MIFLDIESRSAHFRNHFYNSSLISYPFPTRTMTFGLLGSILGFPHDSYHKDFSESKIAVCIKSKNLYKDTVVVNHREPTKMMQATQVYIEYVKSYDGKVSYRIYYKGSLEENILKSLNNYNGYHLYLGATECLASIIAFNKCEFTEVKTKESVYIDSTIPLQLIENIFYKFDDSNTELKYEKYRNVYGWENHRGESLGVYDNLCETIMGKIYCKLNGNLSLSIAVLADDTRRSIEGILGKTSKGDIIYAF